jgi:hypothetical protein
MLDLLAQPHNSKPYVQIGMIMVLKEKWVPNKTVDLRMASC